MRAEFDKYSEILKKWQKSVNLVSPDSLLDLERRHFDDSAQLADYIPANTKIIDMGSGAGFPGAVLAILGYDVTCVESDQKKCAFLSELKHELRLDSLTVVNDRLEKYIEKAGISYENTGFTARAFAPLPKIMEILSKTVQKGRFFLLKGRQINDEIATAKMKFDFDYQLFPSKTGDGFVFVAEFNGPKN
ncbi:ribosomal RNA small subunit methyltransferase G [Bacteroidia bacterium]|nr:ribosomal RNA small subunit methyltransferase G [Bacteroidia bacterium]